ncbi:MAG: hypothetical protein AB1485_05585 [Candidatus Thermoplasmatota archaeon]
MISSDLKKRCEEEIAKAKKRLKEGPGFSEGLIRGKWTTYKKLSDFLDEEEIGRALKEGAPFCPKTAGVCSHNNVEVVGEMRYIVDEKVCNTCPELLEWIPEQIAMARIEAKRRFWARLFIITAVWVLIAFLPAFIIYSTLHGLSIIPLLIFPLIYATCFCIFFLSRMWGRLGERRFGD